MGSYETTIDTLAGELTRIEAAFRGLTGPEWATSTQLVPVDGPCRTGRCSSWLATSTSRSA